jgi:hypothetical protein
MIRAGSAPGNTRRSTCAIAAATTSPSIVERDRELFRRTLEQLGTACPTDQPERRLDQLASRSGLIAAAGLGVLLVTGLGAGLRRSRWRDRRGALMLLACLGLTVCSACWLPRTLMPSSQRGRPDRSGTIPQLWLWGLVVLLGWQLLLPCACLPLPSEPRA